MSLSNLPGECVIPFTQPPNPHHGGHTAQFYADDAFLLDSLSQYVARALQGGDAAIVVATKAHCDGLARKLYGLGIETAVAARQGRYLVADALASLAKFMIEGMPDTARFVEFAGALISQAELAVKPTGGRVVAFGEMVAVLWAEGRREAALQLERLWNELQRSYSFSLLCAYPIAGFPLAEDGESFLDICRQHSAVTPSENYTSLDSEEARLRNIADLQQKAHALETEKAARRQSERLWKRRETELAELLENAIEGAQQIGGDQKVLWANKALLKLLGYAPGEYVNRPFADFCENPEAFVEFWRRLMLREDLYDYPLELNCKDGSRKQVMIHCNGRWEGGNFVHARCFIRDVTEQKRTEDALRQSEAELREAKVQLEGIVEQRTAALRRLSLRALTLRDAERRRIARELHDSLGQYLVGLKLSIDTLRHFPDRDDLWTESEKLMEECIVETRTLSYLLHPPMLEEAGLGSAIRWYVEGFTKRSSLQLSADIPDDLERLPEEVELALFRILQEALTNVHRHAGATAAEIRISRDAEEVILEVTDNGGGIQPELLARFREVGAGMGVGLTGIQERVRELKGRLGLQSTATGTTLTVTVPVPAGETV